MGSFIRREIRVASELGFHARTSGALAQLCDLFEASAIVRFDGEAADACSIFEVMLLAVPHGAIIEVEASGEDAEAMVDALEALIVDEVLPRPQRRKAFRRFPRFDASKVPS